MQISRLFMHLIEKQAFSYGSISRNSSSDRFSELLSGSCRRFFKITVFAMAYKFRFLKCFWQVFSIISAEVSKNTLQCNSSVFHCAEQLLLKAQRWPQILISRLSTLSSYGRLCEWMINHPRGCARGCYFQGLLAIHVVNIFLKTTCAPCCQVFSMPLLFYPWAM